MPRTRISNSTSAPGALCVARVAHARRARLSTELELRVGDLIVVTEALPTATWWRGRTTEGLEGEFPCAYVEDFSETVTHGMELEARHRPACEAARESLARSRPPFHSARAGLRGSLSESLRARRRYASVGSPPHAWRRSEWHSACGGERRSSWSARGARPPPSSDLALRSAPPARIFFAPERLLPPA